LLDKQLKTLLAMETIKKTEPINSKGSKKKRFYEIVDNLMRFYFTFIYGQAGSVLRVGEEQFFDRKIDGVLNQFVSRHLKGIALQYFHRMAINGQYEDIEDFGSYWYDDPVTKTNEEFDCVIKRTGDLFDFYECKYFSRPLTLKECDKEAMEIRHIPTIKAAKIGFISVSGFAFAHQGDFILVDGEELYR